MAVELYFYRCKKSCYEQHAKDLHTLSREVLSADWRWLNLACAEQGVPLMEPSETAIDAYRCPRESDNVISVNGWVEHAGAVFNWLNAYTRLAVASAFPVMISSKTVQELYKTCQEVLSGNYEDFWFFSGTDEPIEKLREGFRQTVRTLDELFSTFDLETEVILVQTNW